MSHTGRKNWQTLMMTILHFKKIKKIVDTEKQIYKLIWQLKNNLQYRNNKTYIKTMNNEQYININRTQELEFDKLLVVINGNGGKQ